MRWPELLDAMQAVLRAALPDSLVAVGGWSVAPNVDTVQLQMALERPQGYGFTEYKVWLDLFVRVESGTADIEAYRKLDASQQTIEAALKQFNRDTGDVIKVTFVAWEPCGGAFVPTYGNRLECLVVCVTDDGFCGGGDISPLI